MRHKDYAVRDAKIEDAKRLLNIYEYYVQNTAITFEYETPTLQEFENRMQKTMERYPYLVIEKDGEIMGYAYAGVFKDRAAYDWSSELTVYLDHQVQKCGLGRTIYEALEERLKQMGIRNLYVCIAQPEVEDEYLTKNSVRFHAHMGFIQVGEFHKCGYKFGRWYDMIWMEKCIGVHEQVERSTRVHNQVEGLKLRKWELSDAKELAAALSNKKVQDNLRDGLPYPYTEQDGRDYIAMMLSADENDTFAFAITVEDQVIGSIAIFRQGNIHHQTGELGYYISEEYWGKGIMTEAVKRICQHVFEQSDIIRIFAEPFAYNVASCLVLEKAGFCYEGTLRSNAVKNGNVLDMKMYSLLKED